MAVSGHHLRMAALRWHIVEVRFSWLCLELCELLLGTAHLHTCTYQHPSCAGLTCTVLLLATAQVG